MAWLVNLSDDLILEILSHLEYDKATLLVVSLVQKRIGRLSQPYLYKHARLDICTENYEQFARSINMNEILRPLVRDLNILWIERPGAELPRQSAQHLVAQLPCVQEFSLRIETSSPFDSRLYVRPVSPACNYTLTVRSQCTETTDMAEFIFTSGAHSLTVNYLTLSSLSRNFNAPSNATLHTAPLQSLDLHYSICVPFPVLNTLLSFPSSLRTLRCAIPGMSSIEILTDATRYLLPRQRGHLKPSTISRALSPVAKSLETLELIGAGEEWSSYDGSRLDLSAFTQLKRLSVASHLLLDSPQAGPKRNGLYALLPLALEELTINFDFGNYILTAPSLNGHTHINSTTLISYYAWIAELATHKPIHFPGLRTVSLMERTKSSKGRQSACKAWAVPEDLKGAFDVAGIELWTRQRAF